MSLKRQFFWSMAPLLVVTLVNFASVPLFLRYLGTDLYALWFYVITFTGMFGFADLGLGVAVGRYIGVALGRGDKAAVREYWATGNIIVIPLIGVMAVVFAVLGAVFGPRWFDKVPPESIGLLRGCFIAGGVGLFFAFYTQFWNILSQAHLDFRFASLLRTAMTLFQVIPSIGIAWATRNPLWLIVWSAVAGVLQLALFIWHARSHYGLGVGFQFARMARAREMAAYTAKTFFTLVVGSCFINIDRVILGRLALPELFTHYTICGNVGQRLQGLGASVMGPVFHNTNRSIEGGFVQAGRIFDEMFGFLCGWYCLALLWSAVWSSVLFRVWLGAEVGVAAAPLLAPLVAAFCVNALASVSGSQLASLNRLGIAMFFSILSGLMAVVGVYLGWRWNGIVGSAWGFLASRFALIAQDFFTMRLINARGWFSPKLWRDVIIQGGVAAVFATAYYLFPIDSCWLLIPAALHLTVVTGWLLREQLLRLLGYPRVLPPSTPTASTS